MSQVLYRKYRAKTFDALIGQDQIVKILKSTVENNNPAHAYLFTGPRGTGKTSTARIFSQALNCLKPIEGNPCNNCLICKSIASNQFLDIIEIDAASNRGINEIRELKEKIAFSPVQGKYKVYIIDEVHMLTKEAFNAILKTLEEPPAQIIFILATTEVNKIPITIISRVLRFDFKLASISDLKSKLNYILENEKISSEEDSLNNLIKMARGSYRDAESLLEKILNTVKPSEKITKKKIDEELGLGFEENVDYIVSQISSLAEVDIISLVLLLDNLYAEGFNIQQLIQEIIAKSLETIMTSYELKKVIDLKSLFRLCTDLQTILSNYNVHLDPFMTLKISILNILTTKKDSLIKSEPERSNNTPKEKVIVNHSVHITANLDDKTLSAVTMSSNDVKKITTQSYGEASVIIEEIKKVSPRLSTIFSQGKLIKEEDKFVLIVPYKFHMQQLLMSKNKILITQVLRTYAGGDVEFSVNVGSVGVNLDSPPSKIVDNTEMVEDIFSDIIN